MGVTVYRGEGFNFPPARGRDGIEFRRDGTFVDWGIGAGDNQQGITGHWDATDLLTFVLLSARRVRSAPSRSCRSMGTF